MSQKRKLPRKVKLRIQFVDVQKESKMTETQTLETKIQDKTIDIKRREDGSYVWSLYFRKNMAILTNNLGNYYGTVRYYGKK